MKLNEKEQIAKLLKRLTYNTKSHKLSYKNEDGGTYFNGSCVNVFKKELSKLLESFEVDTPAPKKNPEYKKPTISYLVKLSDDPKAPVIWTCSTLQEVFTQTRSQTVNESTMNPFTVIEKKTSYRVLDRKEWSSPEMEKKWNDYVRLKNEIGEARQPDHLD